MRTCAARFASCLLALLVAFSVNASGGGHAHAALAAHVTTDQTEAAAGEAHTNPARAHAVPCDDGGNDMGGKDGCCMSLSSCGACAPLPSVELAFLSQGLPAGSAIGSASLPRDPPTLRRPPKLSVTA